MAGWPATGRGNWRGGVGERTGGGGEPTGRKTRSNSLQGIDKPKGKPRWGTLGNQQKQKPAPY